MLAYSRADADGDLREFVAAVSPHLALPGR
jgi:hypothetical protein